MTTQFIFLCIFQSVSPGSVATEIIQAGEFDNAEDFFKNSPHLNSVDISQAILYLLSTPYNVNVTELTIKPVGEK